MIAPLPEASTSQDHGTQAPERPLVVRVLRRWRSPLVLLPLLAGLLVAAGTGAGMLWAEIPDRDLPADVTCWDGAVGPLATCTEPEGVAGLRWVFPSFRPGRDDCARIEREERAEERPTEFGCVVDLDDQSADVVYSVRTSLEQGLAFLARRYAGIEPARVARGERLAYRDPQPDDGRYFVTVAYVEHPFAVTVEAANRAIRDRVLADLVEFRAADEVRGRPEAVE